MSLRPLAMALSLALAGCMAPAPDDPLDDRGGPVAEHRLDRVVATSVDVVEIMVALGHGHRLAAVPSWIESDSTCVAAAPGVPDVPRIGKPHVIIAEQIVALAPDLVIDKPHPLQPTDLSQQLRQAGVAVYVLDNTENVENVRHTLRTVARLLSPVDAGAPERAEQIIADFDARMAVVAHALAADNTSALRTMYLFPAGLVGGQGTTADQLIQLAGGSNIPNVRGYRQISSEALAAHDPQRIIVSCTAAGSADAIFGAPRLADTAAARYRPETLLVLDPAVSALVGPRFAEAVEQVAQWLHPAAFGLLDPRIDVHREQRTLVIDWTNASADDAPLTLRVDPGDGTGLQQAPQRLFRYDYADDAPRTAVVLAIDAQGRIHETHHQL